MYKCLVWRITTEQFTCWAKQIAELFPGENKTVLCAVQISRQNPLAEISTIRYEAKHLEGKITSRSAVSRVNICKIIAIKHQLRQNYRFLRHITPKLISYDQKLSKKLLLIDLKGYVELCESLRILKNETVETVKKVDFQGTYRSWHSYYEPHWKWPFFLCGRHHYCQYSVSVIFQCKTFTICVPQWAYRFLWIINAKIFLGNLRFGEIIFL